MARSLAADLLEIDPDTVEVELRTDQRENIEHAVADAKEKLALVDVFVAEAAQANANAVHQLRDSGFTVREVATIMEISLSRVHQIGTKGFQGTVVARSGGVAIRGSSVPKE